MQYQHQKSNRTSTNRYPLIFKKVQLYLKDVCSILSFGCSSGEETLSLRERFPDARIYGVDINTDMRQKAIKLTESDPNIFIVSLEECKTRKFDLITAMSVLCSHFHHSGGYTFDLFQNTVSELVQLLTPGTGHLLVYNSQYHVSDCKGLELWETTVQCFPGHVAMYKEGDEYSREVSKCILWTNKNPYKNNKRRFNDISQNEQDPTNQSDELHIGVLSYESKGSTNIGDYIQTLAQLNIWSFFYNPSKWSVESDALRKVLQYFSSLHAAENSDKYRQKHSFYKKIHVHWIERDNLQDIGPHPVWVIMNGWYMHGSVWPPSSKLIPIFVSMHIANDDVITDYLKQFEPIGCRDLATRDKLRANGIQAYLSGCLTLTLDFEQHEPVFSLDVDMKNIREGAESRKQLEPAFTNDRETGILRAFERLKDFKMSYSTRTSRLHCALPSLAIGAPDIQFSSPDGARDKNWRERDRFTCFNKDSIQMFLQALTTASRLLEALDRLIVCGLSSAHVMDCLNFNGQFTVEDVYEERNALIITPQHNFNTMRQMYPRVISNINTPIQSLYERNYSYILRSAPLSIFREVCSIVVTSDENYISIAHVMLTSLSRNNPSLLFHVYLIARRINNTSKALFLQKTARLPNVVIHWIRKDDAVLNYKTPLSHVTESCLDRLDLLQIDYSPMTEKIVYLDLDVLVIGSIEPLLSLNTGEIGIAAKSSRLHTVRNWLSRIHAEAKVSYVHNRSFNAGVMVIDKLTLENNDFDEKIAQIRSGNDFNDQIILNLFAQAKYKELPAKYNVFVGQDDANFTLFQGLDDSAVILHFVGSNKPWQSGFTGKKIYSDLWSYFSVPITRQIRKG